MLDREALLDDRLVLTGDQRLLALLGIPMVATTNPDVTDAGSRTLLARTVELPAVPPSRPSDGVPPWPGVSQADTTLCRVAVDLAHHYRLPARSIDAIAAEWEAATDRSAGELRRLTRERARVGLGGLAERVEPRAGGTTWSLPGGAAALLRDLVRQVRRRSQVYDDWGFGVPVEPRPRDHRAVRRRERHRQDHGGRGDRRTSSASTCTASTCRRW